MATRNVNVVDTPGPGPAEDMYIPGAGGSSYELPAATTSTMGGVKKASSVAAVSAADATSTASTETVDPTEFAAVVTLCNELKAKLNSVLTNVKSAGQME